MESRTVDADGFVPSEHGFTDALREAIEEEMDFLDDRDLHLVRMRENDDGEIQQVTIQADDEMYRLSEVSPGNVSRTVFRNPKRDEAVPYQDGDGGDAEAVDEADGEAEDDEAGDETPEDG
ncbi:MAG: hypothetical protein ACI9QA_000775 [Methanobacteriota archaeon]|jgi:hypothetical protein|uniref:Uncharacterized protein n=1 Tax=Halorutilus salinus TaxID=2487751 RepID=A0A9Q4GHK3_9EURY|nr:hypothetical protein [Halorutilus salinus]MCX2817883.1 hypothetical protein [Halorutilus salinus]